MEGDYLELVVDQTGRSYYRGSQFTSTLIAYIALATFTVFFAWMRGLARRRHDASGSG